MNGQAPVLLRCFIQYVVVFTENAENAENAENDHTGSWSKLLSKLQKDHIRAHAY